METLFNDLLEQYRQFRTFVAWYELSTNEFKSFVENVRARVIRIQAEHDSRIEELKELIAGVTDSTQKAAAFEEIEELQAFPARVIDCEVREFERMIRTIEEAYEEGHRHKMNLCDAYEACRFELERLRDNFVADSLRISQNTTFEESVKIWESIQNGGLAKNQRGEANNERI